MFALGPNDGEKFKVLAVEFEGAIMRRLEESADCVSMNNMYFVYSKSWDMHQPVPLNFKLVASNFTTYTVNVQ